MWGEGLLHDLRLAVRSLRAAPLVSLAAVVSLALGMGANTAIFSLLNGLLLRPLPVHDPYRLATISSDQAIGLGFRSGPGWNYPMWEQFRRLENGFAGAAVYTSVSTSPRAANRSRSPRSS
jgi:hypothetical protein